MSSNDSLVNTLYAADCAYQCGCPERAIQIANPLANDSANPAVSLVAQTICLASHIASGRGEDAYNDLLHAIRGCRVGLRCKEDLQLYGVSMLCAMRIEALVVASIFDFDSFDEDVDMMPFEFKRHLGYLLSMRAMRQNKEQVAVGISYAHLRTFAKMDDLSRIRLNLVMAAGNMVQGDTNEAEDIFMHALAMAESSGIVMPFVETNCSLLGLPRHCQGSIADDLSERIRSHIRAYHKGWFGLRRCCGLSEAGRELTPLELDVTLLAAHGWLNKEIALHLGISENTVKRNLSNVYRKLGVSNRAEVRRVVYDAIYFAVTEIS